MTAWFVLDSRNGLRLARERQDLLDDSVTSALEAMIKGPRDPDYSTTWDSGTRVLSVLQEPGLITVDLSAEARTATVGSAGAALMVQESGFTMTAAGQEFAPLAFDLDLEPGEYTIEDDPSGGEMAGTPMSDTRTCFVH